MKEEIMILRQRTGAGVMDAKRAFTEASGDLARAEQIIHERHGGRPPSGVATSGAVFCGTHQGRIGALVEIRCQTDFAARTEEFQAFGRETVTQVLGADPADVLSLMAQDLLRPEYDEKGVLKPHRTVQQLMQQLIARTGETVEIARFTRFELGRS
jgi:elongation factor Ts